MTNLFHPDGVNNKSMGLLQFSDETNNRCKSVKLLERSEKSVVKAKQKEL